MSIYRIASGVEQVSTSTGTGDISLTAPRNGRRSFVDAIGDSAWCPVRIDDEFGNYEICIAEVAAGTPDKIMRGGTQIFLEGQLGGVAAGAPVSFPAGLKTVTCDLPADLIAWPGQAKAFGETTIASATTTDLGSSQTFAVVISGTTTITGLGSQPNTLRFVRFSGALTLTHNATSLILPGALNIKTGAGDTALFISNNSGNWRCLSYQRASQPSFHAYKGAASNNATGDGTDFTVVFSSVDWDTGGNYNNSTGEFTAPIAGKYFFAATVLVTAAGAGHTTGYLRIQNSAGVSGVRAEYAPSVFATAGEGSFTASCVMNLNAGDTVKVIVTVSNGTKTVGIYGGALGAVMYTNFQGFLIPG